MFYGEKQIYDEKMFYDEMFYDDWSSAKVERTVKWNFIYPKPTQHL